ncbi:MAG TPA: decaprenyl-phosphate phosphoribosyltransferase [Drouetiella sp.]
MDSAPTNTTDNAEPEKVAAPSSSGFVKLWLKQLRWKQWPKNFICFAPLLFSGKFLDSHALTAALLCFVAFCMVSSGIYVLNDIMDVKADRLHPVKRNRPIASGQLNIQFAFVVGAISLLGGFFLAYTLRHSLTFIFLGYVLLNVGYSIWLKHVAIIDILCISSGFVFRAIAGAIAINVMPSSWFLLCTTLGALFLAMEKRRQEIIVLTHDSSSHRKALTDYSLPLIARFESVVVPSLLTSYAFYTFNSPHGQYMMLTIPVVIYGLMRYQQISQRGTETGTPEEVLLKDRPIQCTVLIWVIICAVVVLFHPRDLVAKFSQMIDEQSRTYP